jgi:outer membrane immunogenic protein
MAGAASAADLDVVRPVYRPAYVQRTYDWTGLYLGINAGYGWAHGTSSLGFTTGTPPPPPPPPGDPPPLPVVLNGLTLTSAADLDGGVVGGQLGFNWQAGWVVFGFEVDGMWLGQKQTVTTVSTAVQCGTGCLVVDAVKLRALVTGRGRIGAAWDRVLVYATFGGAWANASDDLTVTANGVTATLLTISNTKGGFTAGAGVEGAFWDHWSARLEYLYVDIDGLTSNGGAGVFVVNGTGTVAETWRFRDHIVRGAVNYRFGP